MGMCHWRGPGLFWGIWEGESGAVFGAVHPFPYSQCRGELNWDCPRAGVGVGVPHFQGNLAEVSGDAQGWHESTAGQFGSLWKLVLSLERLLHLLAICSDAALVSKTGLFYQLFVFVLSVCFLSLVFAVCVLGRFFQYN